MSPFTGITGNPLDLSRSLMLYDRASLEDPESGECEEEDKVEKPMRCKKGLGPNSCPFRPNASVP